jgi:deoxyribodipyrimidine photo-lyase
MGHKILIYLLRRDLRLSDNPVFHEVSQILSAKTEAQFTHLLPLYIFSASQIEISGFRNITDEDEPWPFPEARSRIGRFWRCGPHRAKFLAESVWDLKQSLENVGSGLCIRAGEPEEIIKDALESYENFKGQEYSAEIVGVWMTAEEGTEEKQEERNIRKLVEGFKKEFRLFRDEKYFVDE